MSFDDIFRNSIHQRRVTLLLRGGGKFEGIPSGIEGETWILSVDLPEAGELHILRSEVTGLFVSHRSSSDLSTRAVEYIWREAAPSDNEARTASLMLQAIEAALLDLPVEQASKAERILLRSSLHGCITFEENKLQIEFEAGVPVPSRAELGSLLALIL